jgi:hypothetical protein
LSHKTPNVFVDFIASRIIETQKDLLRLLNDGGVNGGVKSNDGGANGGVKSNDGGANGGVKSNDGGVNLEELIFEYIAQHPGIKAPAIAEELQKSLRTTQRYLKTLSDSGRIEFRGAPKNGGYYQITNNK